MPLPPLCGPVLYGSTIGIRSTLDSDPRLPPYYISVPGSSRSSATFVPSLPRSAAGQRTPLDNPPPAGDITSASAAVTVASTPSPFASPASQEEREEQAAKHSSRLMPVSCCSDHPYRESSASEFCIISANVSTSVVPVCEYDEVFLIGGPTLRDFLHPSQQQPPSSLRRGYSASVQAQKGDASSTAAQRAAAAPADRRTVHLLWVVCCPSKAELQEQQQRRQPSHRSPHLRGKEAIILTRNDNGKQQQEPAEDEEPVRLKTVVCADIKQLQQAVDSHCKWRVLRQSGSLMLRQNAAHSASVAAVKAGPQRTRPTAFDPTAAAEAAAVGAPLRWDEEIYFQNVHNGCFLSVRHYKQRPWSSEILALSVAAAAATITAHRTPSSPSDHAVSAADGALAAQAAGQKARLLPGIAASAAATGGSVSSAGVAGDRDMAAATGAAAAAEQKHSSWRLVLAGIAAPPWWNRQCACTLMAPTEIDDCLLRRETLNGVSIAAYLQTADPQFPFSSLRGASAVREAAAGGGAVWWRQQRQALALSPYTSCCKFHSDQDAAAGDSESSACAAAASAEKSRTSVNRSSQQLPLQGGGPACLSESWRQASAFGQQQVGENEWVMQRLHRDWKFLPREVKERFLLEDLLFCLSGIDGTLVRVFAVQEACCCAAVAAASHQASPSSSCSTSDDSRRGSSSSSGSEQVPCCCPRPKLSSGRRGPPLHCYNNVRRVLPQFRSWLHPLLTGASCCGSSEAAAADAGSQHRGSSCRESFQSLYMQKSSLERASAEPLHATAGNDGFFPSSEDYTFCQILPSLMPAACSLRLLLVFLELAGRSQSTRSSSSSSSKVFCSGVRSCCSSSSNGAVQCEQERRPGKSSPEEREALQHASTRELPPFFLCDGAATNAPPSAAPAARGTCCGTRAVEEEEDEGGGGAVLDALCVALRKVVEEIGMQVGVWEGEVRRGRLTLQGLRAQLGPIARAAAVAEQIARLAFGKRGGSILNAIEEVQKSIPCNDSCQEVCRFLFEKAAAPLVGMVEKWIHRGKVVDPYDEFFIVYEK